jgi:hypothetical protein
LKSVLLPEFGLPTTAMLADGFRRCDIWSAGTRVTDSLLTLSGWGNGEMPCLFAAQRNRVTEHPEFKRITTNGRTRQLYLNAFYQSEDH